MPLPTETFETSMAKQVEEDNTIPMNIEELDAEPGQQVKLHKYLPTCQLDTFSICWTFGNCKEKGGG